MDNEEREIYEARLKWLRDEEMAIKKAEQKGREEGKKERELEIARNMKQAGMDLAVIKELTGLTEEEIEGL